MLHRHRGRSSGFGYSHFLIWPALALVVLGFAVFLAAHGVSLAVVLAICTIVPWIIVIAFELFAGAQHEAHVLESLGVEGHEVDGRRADVS